MPAQNGWHPDLTVDTRKEETIEDKISRRRFTLHLASLAAQAVMAATRKTELLLLTHDDINLRAF
jgi:hypothetical protein